MSKKHSGKRNTIWITLAALTAVLAAVLLLAGIRLLKNAGGERIRQASEPSGTEDVSAGESTSGTKAPEDPDTDGDGIPDTEEEKLGTSVILDDTDRDGLNDREEGEKYGTDPLKADTDEDGVWDGEEIRLGSDPLKKNEYFITKVSSDPLSEAHPVAFTVSAMTDAAGAGSLSAEEITSTNLPGLTPASYGYLAPAVELLTEGELKEAEICFTYDPSLGEPGEYFDPCIYYYDREEGELIPVEDQYAENGKVTAKLTHFSIYTLMNRYLISLEQIVAEELQSSLLADRNKDGLADYYVQLINNGSLRYDNTDWLFNVTERYGADNPDWDGDGLLNGEEIRVGMAWDGSLKIIIRSNPLLTDSDFDNIPDYDEVHFTLTDPLLYDRRSKSALDHLYNDGEYGYMLRKKGYEDNVAQTLENILSYIDSDSLNAKQAAKECLINYLSDYASPETIEKNAKALSEYAEQQKAFEYLCVFCKLVHAAKDVYTITDSTGKYLDLKAGYTESLELQKTALNDFNLRKCNTVKDTVKTSKLMKAAENYSDQIIEEKNSDSDKKRTEMIDATTSLIEVLASAAEACQDCEENYLISVGKEVSSYQKNAARLGKNAVKLKNTFTLAADVADMAGDMLETAALYGKIIANFDAYNMYAELLTEIIETAENDYVAAAAKELGGMILDHCNETFYKDLALVMAKDVLVAGAEILVDRLAEVHPAMVIVELFLDVYGDTGVYDQALYNVYFDVMSAVSAASKSLLNQKIMAYKTSTFEYLPEDAAFVEKYLVQLAQSRIMGEYYLCEYCQVDNAAALLNNLLWPNQKADYDAIFDRAAENVFGYADRLQLKLSPNLPGYKHHDPAAREDPIVYEYTEENILCEMAGEYCLTSGVGAWGDYLTVEKDGSFRGSYYDMNAGIPGELNGMRYDATEYVLDYHGCFTKAEKIDVDIFRLTIEYTVDTDLTLDEVRMSEYGTPTRYIAASRAGFDPEKEINLILPSYPEKYLRNQNFSMFGIERDFLIDNGGDNQNALYYVRLEKGYYHSRSTAYLDFIEKGSYRNMQDYVDGAALSYYTKDLDQDGIPELIVENGTGEKRTAYAYAYENGKVVSRGPVQTGD